MNTKIDQLRQKRLSGNFRRMFFIQAFQNIRTINIVVTLFYLARGSSLSQVFYLSIIWSLVNILFEVPSSYLADSWGRKKTIVLGVGLYVISCFWLIFSYSFWMLAVSVFFYALSNACFTGTDDALIYDTNRELDRPEDSLRRFGQYYAAEKIFKIFSPLVGAFVARDLTNFQYNTLLLIDAGAAITSFIISFYIVEPKCHYLKVEKVEAGILQDAFRLIKRNPTMIRIVCNRALGFISFFIIWRFHQELFVKIGTPIVMLGIGWSVLHFACFMFNSFIHKIFPHIGATTKINIFNILGIISIVFFLIAWWWGFHYYWLLAIYLLGNFFENIRWPIFADLLNKYSNSFNRATTLSLSNFIKSIFDIPFLFLSGLLIKFGRIYPVYIAFAIILVSTFIFYLPKKVKFENKF